MPLPNLKVQCSAPNRNTGNRCKNPAAFGCKTCRYHGARRNIKVNEAHPNYKHGKRTKVAIETLRTKMRELDALEDMALSAGMLASRRRGRRSR
jgi:hypothetical protein